MSTNQERIERQLEKKKQDLEKLKADIKKKELALKESRRKIRNKNLIHVGIAVEKLLTDKDQEGNYIFDFYQPNESEKVKAELEKIFSLYRKTKEDR